MASRNQQHYAGRSILHSAGKDIEQFAVAGDIRAIANQGRVIHQAQHNGIEVTAQKDVTVTSTEEGVVVRGQKCILLVAGDGTYLRLGDGQAVFGMKGQFIVKTASLVLQGPSTLSMDLPHFSNTAFNESFVVTDQAGELVPKMKFRLTHTDGGVVEGVTGADAKIPLQKGIGPDSVKLELLGLQN
ncbi:uncharacterized protein (DUF2345 family) [Variovorax boronicumulans]|uniref:Uncharacterized protein (DUF2345 family) n=1 Tax=Variovorax boronicumulans TaxID=436515 RepID=A0AAW8DVF7_9BURK|nr:uncharacterized protein (DUF2345 family) [Variovorax boronicumulans]MDP9923515.1 uncharacterized protein (DUF2345 family) [Variovorax boronicumulans]